MSKLQLQNIEAALPFGNLILGFDLTFGLWTLTLKVTILSFGWILCPLMTGH